MLTSRILRNLGSTGNRLLNESGGGPKDKMMLYGAGGLALLTGLVYWAGYHSEGMSKNAKEHAKSFDAVKK